MKRVCEDGFNTSEVYKKSFVGKHKRQKLFFCLAHTWLYSCLNCSLFHKTTMKYEIMIK